MTRTSTTIGASRFEECIIMGDTKPFPKCMRFIAAFSRHPELLEWCWSRVEASIAPILLKSPAFAFLESEYYSKTMGS
ncbi:MAG: hypothetical protein KGQ60_17065, partial [Planctomycetes bacterium]|nr:hypothetical protein [Planctomycetota bacterium]